MATRADNLPTEAEAVEAVKTLIRWWGDDPQREGLLDTPKRVLKAAREFGAGYAQSGAEMLAKRFKETEGYDQMIAVRGMDFISHCEHHMVPFIGTIDVVYLPNDEVVGLSKFGRVSDVFAKRLQVQERLTQEIGEAIMEAVEPRGLLVRVTASHMCMCHRGVKKTDASMATQFLGGSFKENPMERMEAIDLLRHAR